MISITIHTEGAAWEMDADNELEHVLGQVSWMTPFKVVGYTKVLFDSNGNTTGRVTVS